jgi:hypothetical protein
LNDLFDCIDAFGILDQGNRQDLIIGLLGVFDEGRLPIAGGACTSVHSPNALRWITAGLHQCDGICRRAHMGHDDPECATIQHA